MPRKIKDNKIVNSFDNFLKLSYYQLEFLSIWLHCEFSDLLIVQQLCQNNGVYKEFKIPKGNKKEKRVLHVPTEEMKNVQRNILDHVLSFIPVHYAVYGCRKSTSFIAGAQHLSGFTKSLFSLDLRHAFPSVTRRRVESNLNKPISFQLVQFGHFFKKEEIDQLVQSIIDLVVFQDSIPQGAPTSPILLNICCRKLDREIISFLENLKRNSGNDYRYVRYVDDISIGCNNENGLSEKERKDLKHIVKECGFHINPEKENYVPMVGKGRDVAEVTGVRIHQSGKLSLDKKQLSVYRTRLNAILKRLESGEKDHVLTGQAHGLIGYINQVYSDKIPSNIISIATKVKMALAIN